MTTILLKTPESWDTPTDEFVAHVAQIFYCFGGDPETGRFLESMLDALDGFYAV